MMKTNTITPCSACRLLRRRCAKECPFSPYFSPDEPLKFASVHKVFGASNVAKMLSEVPENQRADTASSLVYEAMLRLSDPVYGCAGAIAILQRQLQSLEAELNSVRAKILRYKLKEARLVGGHNESSLSRPLSRPYSVTAPPPARTISSVPSIFTQANTSSTSQYKTVTSGNVAYFS